MASYAKICNVDYNNKYVYIPNARTTLTSTRKDLKISFGTMLQELARMIKIISSARYSSCGNMSTWQQKEYLRLLNVFTIVNF